MSKLYIIGAGGLAKDVASLLVDAERHEEITAFVDKGSDDGKTQLFDRPIISQSDLALSTDDRVVVAIGDSGLRQRVVDGLPRDANFESLIHPSANISPDAQVGIGAVILSHCLIFSHVQIGDFCQLNPATQISHDSVIGDYFSAGPKATVGGGCQLGSNVYIGMHASVRQLTTICSDVVIGMGAAVVKNITVPGTYVGVPAKTIQII